MRFAKEMEGTGIITHRHVREPMTGVGAAARKGSDAAAFN